MFIHFITDDDCDDDVGNWVNRNTFMKYTYTCIEYIYIYNHIYAFLYCTNTYRSGTGTCSGINESSFSILLYVEIDLTMLDGISRAILLDSLSTIARTIRPIAHRNNSGVLVWICCRLLIWIPRISSSRSSLWRSRLVVFSYIFFLFRF